MGEIQNHIDELCGNIDRRQKDGILEKQDADLLRRLIRENPDDADQIASLGTMLHRTGLVFQTQSEKYTDRIQFLRRDDALSFSSGEGPANRLIIGDNYPALQNLLIGYRGAVDVIYIDPPYGKDSMGGFAQTNYENEISRDTLLSALMPRLTLARELLSDEGVIFVSIDDRNQAYVKCLMDEIFGERNLLANLAVVNNRAGRSDSGYYATSTEYCLAYGKNASHVVIRGLELNEDTEASFTLSDQFGRYRLDGLKKTGKNCYREDRPHMYYPIYYSPSHDQADLVPRFSDDIEILPSINGRDGRWRWGKEKFLKNKDANISCKQQKDGYVVYAKTRYEVDGSVRTSKPKTIWDKKEYSTTNGTNTLKEIIGNKNFQNPKSVFFVKDLIATVSKADSLVLDFYAGSGTTGQAVLDLNREDGGSRRFILVTNDDHGTNGEYPRGIGHDVTYERLFRVMNGKGTKGETFPWLEKHAPYGGSLEVLTIEGAGVMDCPEHSILSSIDETLYGLPRFSTLTDKFLWICRNFRNASRVLGKEAGV